MGFIEDLERDQLMVAVRTDTPEQAFKAAEACIEGGIRFIEITFSVPDADQVIKKLSSNPEAKIGAGTILSVEDVRKAMKAGASYIVSPNFSEEVVKFTKKEGAISIPGACTPTEIYRAWSAGADIIKLFPFEEIGGLKFLKAIRGPFPFIKYLLCGGMKMENINSYLEARAAGILTGTAVIKRELVTSGDWPAITALAKGFVQKVKEFNA